MYQVNIVIQRKTIFTYTLQINVGISLTPPYWRYLSYLLLAVTYYYLTIKYTCSIKIGLGKAVMG